MSKVKVFVDRELFDSLLDLFEHQGWSRDIYEKDPDLAINTALMFFIELAEDSEERAKRTKKKSKRKKKK